MSTSPTSPVSTPHYFNLSPSAFSDPPTQPSNDENSQLSQSSQPLSQDPPPNFKRTVVEQASTIVSLVPIHFGSEAQKQSVDGSKFTKN